MLFSRLDTQALYEGRPKRAQTKTDMKSGNYFNHRSYSTFTRPGLRRPNPFRSWVAAAVLVLLASKQSKPEAGQSLRESQGRDVSKAGVWLEMDLVRPGCLTNAGEIRIGGVLQMSGQ